MARVYDTQAWKRVRTAFLAQHPLCVMCDAQGKATPAHHVDHIVPIADGGDWYDTDNLQGLCATHHSQKTARDEGKTVRMGCDASGLPIDRSHHWNNAGGLL